MKVSPVLRKIALECGTAVRYLAAIGGAKVAQFARNSRNWRINRWFVLFAVTYLAEEYEEGRLVVGDERKLLSLIAAVFSNDKNEANGAIFQLSQVTYYHAMSQLVNNAPKVLGIEQERPAYELIKGVRTGTAYKRRVDVIIEAEGGEEWIETKSLSKSTFSKTKFRNVPSDKKSYYRQFFHDLRLNDALITSNADNRDRIIPASERMNGNKTYSWFFQQWRESPNKGIPPSSTEETHAQEWLCAKPNISHIKNYYTDNLANNPDVTKSLCRSTRQARIKLRDTESYVTEILLRLIREKGL